MRIGKGFLNILDSAAYAFVSNNSFAKEKESKTNRYMAHEATLLKFFTNKTKKIAIDKLFDKFGVIKIKKRQKLEEA